MVKVKNFVLAASADRQIEVNRERWPELSPSETVEALSCLVQEWLNIQLSAGEDPVSSIDEEDMTFA